MIVGVVEIARAVGGRPVDRNGQRENVWKNRVSTYLAVWRRGQSFFHERPFDGVLGFPVNKFQN